MATKSSGANDEWVVSVVGAGTAGDQSNSHTVYDVRVVAGKRELGAARPRFSELHNLDKTLRSQYPEEMAQVTAVFPKKTAFSSRSAIIVARQKALDVYLKEVTTVQRLRDSFTVRELLGYHDGVIFYDTLSVCAVCTVVTRKGIVWCPAVVRQDGRDVYLRTTCEIHGMCQSIYSRNAKLFRRLIFPDIVASASQRAMSNRFTSLSEAAAILQRLRSSNVVTDLSLWEDDQLIDDAELQRSLTHFTRFPSRHLVRLLGKLVSDLPAFNSKVLLALEFTAEVAQRFIIELSHDRMISLVNLRNTALLCPRTYPMIKYFLTRGHERQCRRDLVMAIGQLAVISNIHFGVNLCLERPFPDLTVVLDLLRRHRRIVRVIQLTVTRTPAEVVKGAAEQHQSSCGKNGDGSRSNGSQIVFGPGKDKPTADISGLLSMIERATEGEITVEDFLSPSIGYLMVPLIKLLGYGHYGFEPSAASGAVAVLLAEAEHEVAVSLNRVVDMDRLWPHLRPVLQQAEASGWSAAASLSAATKARKLVKLHLRPGVNPPSFLTRALDSSLVRDASRHVGFSQAIFVRRAADIGIVDLEHAGVGGEATMLRRQLLDSLFKEAV